MIGNVVMNNRLRYDLVMIPGMHMDGIQQTLQEEAAVIKWVKLQYDTGAETGCRCTGGSIFDLTRLLGNKMATIHCMAAEAFRRCFQK